METGILEKVSHSAWASPVVTVPKKDGRVRLCGDYKVSVNRSLHVDQHPLPTPEELFSTLTGGQQFSILDLSQVYQQLLLEPSSRELTTISTHRGLYRYTRLPFGIASAPAIFQRTMDTILDGIPNVLCYIDDILITGKTKSEHLQNLQEVLGRLHAHGVRVKSDKCLFFQESVTYLGHRIDASGIHATEDKLEVIFCAPPPRNTSLLKAFLGLLNYYGKFINNLATVIHPLNQLLCRDVPWR